MPIVPQVVETNLDLLTANLFTFEIVGLLMKSPNFSKVDGMSRGVEPVEHPDGGSGLVRKFHGGVVKYENITVTRTRDGSPNDRLMSSFVTSYFGFGIKVDGAFVKRHHGRIIRRIEYLGLGAMQEQWPSYDNAAAAGEDMTYPFHVDWYEEVFF